MALVPAVCQDLGLLWLVCPAFEGNNSSTALLKHDVTSSQGNIPLLALTPSESDDPTLTNASGPPLKKRKVSF